MNSSDSELVALGSVSVTADDITRAWREDVPVFPLELAAPLDARVAALRAWIEETEVEASDSVLEAAASAPLVRGDGGPRFRRPEFDEMVEFIHHLPW